MLVGRRNLGRVFSEDFRRKIFKWFCYCFRFLDFSKCARTRPYILLLLERSGEVQQYLVTKGVTWQFIIKKRLRTILVEIEATINNRPLTHLYEDEISCPLTQTQLNYGRQINKRAAKIRLVYG